MVVTVSTPYTPTLELGNVVGMTRRKFASFDKPDFHSHYSDGYTREDGGGNYGQKDNFHCHFEFSDAKVAI